MSQKKQWDTDLPDTSKWLPRKGATETLRGAFLKRCQGIEKKVLLASELEREMNIDNFDSGIGVEDIIREELSNLLPSRYSVRAGVINDRQGNTAGDFEIIITNDIWFTSIKAGAIKGSRRYHFPIEAIYAVIEVKQTLTFETLDVAMEKLVTCHRLYRPTTPGNRATENCTVILPYDPNVMFNPLLSVIVATRLGNGVSIEDILQRFSKISRSLKREELVRCICVLGEGTINWYTVDNGKTSMMALFVDDLAKPLAPVLNGTNETMSAFYLFAVLLMTHLYRSVLSPEDFPVLYGLSSWQGHIIEEHNIFF